jgi:penicillin-binding protein-related factor A (putative recombinase)
MAKRVRRIIGGMRAEAAGRRFEDALARTHAAYRDHGLADIQRLPVPTRPYGERNLRVLAERQGYDFIGLLGPNAGPDVHLGAYHGRAVVMEAKRSSERAASLPIRRAGQEGFGVKIHQLDALADAYLDFGAIAVIVWRNGEQGLVLLPPDVLAAREATKEDRWRIPAAAFEPYQTVSYPRHPEVEDWLFSVRTWLEEGLPPSPAMSRRKAHPMIHYAIDHMRKTVAVLDAKAKKPIEKVTVQVVDPPIIEQLARSCHTPKEFLEKVKGLQVAHS